MSRFYITTPIYYVNAPPHLGTFYTTVVADSLARYHRAQGEDTFFLTGLDEHGTKIERIARERGLEPQAYTDLMAVKFQEAWRRAEITNDDFIRTTSARHVQAVTEMWKRMEEAGDIYPADYDGMYCVGCEDWKSEDDVIIEAGEKVCPIHHRPVERVKEKNYFFRLKKYAGRLLSLYETPGFIRPESRRNEVASFVRGGLNDISVSRMRKSVAWGIPVPGDHDHVIYVWIDALTNYLTVLGGPGAVAREGTSRERWHAAHHLIAKDILRFHAVYWPAMLMSAGLPMPAGVVCHGYLTVKGQKISKSLPATRVDPLLIADDLGIEPLRYFVLREYALGGDGDFTYEALLQRYESDLGNDLGNLLNRTVSMAHRFRKGTVPPFTPGAADAMEEVVKMGGGWAARSAGALWRDFSPAQALEASWKLIREANRFIDSRKPWVLAKHEDNKHEDNQGGDPLDAVLAICCESLRTTARLIAPAMPGTARKILAQLGRPESEAETWPADGQFAWPGGTMGAPEPLFPRLDAEKKAALIAKWMPADPAAEASPRADGSEPAAGHQHLLPIEKAELDRIELRAARILACERVPKTDKLLKLTLDIGSEQRTVISGIAGAYQPEALVGRTVMYLANLKPAKIRGVISQGMILTAGDTDVLALSAFDREVPPGTRIG